MEAASSFERLNLYQIKRCHILQDIIVCVKNWYTHCCQTQHILSIPSTHRTYCGHTDHS